jgi:hypothetical protein
MDGVPMKLAITTFGVRLCASDSSKRHGLAVVDSRSPEAVAQIKS